MTQHGVCNLIMSLKSTHEHAKHANMQKTERCNATERVYSIYAAHRKGLFHRSYASIPSILRVQQCLASTPLCLHIN